jgi:hypothetical protein
MARRKNPLFEGTGLHSFSRSTSALLCDIAGDRGNGGHNENCCEDSTSSIVNNAAKTQTFPDRSFPAGLRPKPSAGRSGRRGCRTRSCPGILSPSRAGARRPRTPVLWTQTLTARSVRHYWLRVRPRMTDFTRQEGSEASVSALSCEQVTLVYLPKECQTRYSLLRANSQVYTSAHE